MRANIKEVFASPSRLLLSLPDMVQLLNPKIIGMRNYYARRFSRPWLWKIEKYINLKFTRWYNRKKQRNYRLGNPAKVRELTLQAGLASICGWMLKEEEYRKAVCGKTARTVWWGGGGNPTALLYRRNTRRPRIYAPPIPFSLYKSSRRRVWWIFGKPRPIRPGNHQEN